MKILNFSLISNYRQLLMGIAILGVLIAHWFSLSGYKDDNILLGVVKIIPQLVFTQGFLLLSGFGLYYSFCKNSNIEAFYRRRFSRLFIPFAIMICPFLIYFFIVGDINGWQFIGRITSVSYWIYGNYYGMWYIALSVVLYLIYPILHKIIMHNDSFLSVITNNLLLLIAFVAITRLTQLYAPEYYQIHKHAFDHSFMFVVGMYLAYLSKQKIFRQWLGGVFCSFSFACPFFWNDMTNHTFFYM